MKAETILMTVGLVMVGVSVTVSWYLRCRARKHLLFLVRMSRGKIPESLYRATVKTIEDIT